MKTSITMSFALVGISIFLLAGSIFAADIDADIWPINPPIVVSPSESFDFGWRIENLTGDTLYVDTWRVFIDSQSQEILAAGPDAMTLYPYQVRSGTETQDIPTDILSGDYSFEARVGDYDMDDVEAYDNFPIEVE